MHGSPIRFARGRFARVVRRLVRAPLFTSVAVVTLALGIGANTAIFSVVRGVLLKPLPFDQPETLVGVWHTAPGIGVPLLNQAPAFYLTYREEGHTFEDIGLWDTTAVAVTGIGEPERVTALEVTDGTLAVLRVQPAIGRRFTAEDDSPRTPERVMLAHAYWERKFGSDPSVIGRQVMVDGSPREIIGVLPAGFRFLNANPQLVLPFRLNRAEVFVGNFSFQGIARLRPGVTIAEANADMARLIPLVAQRFPMMIKQFWSAPLSVQRSLTYAIRTERVKSPALLKEIQHAVWAVNGNLPVANVRTLADIMSASMAQTSFALVMLGIAASVALLLGIVGIYGVIAYVAAQRTKEIGIRIALGAVSRDVTGLFLRQGLLLASAGILIGLVAAGAATRVMSTLLYGVAALDPVTYVSVAFGLGLTALLASYVPAARAARVDPADALRREV